MPTFLSFGPDRDGLVVEEEVSEVVSQLAGSTAGWPQFTLNRSGAKTAVYVNPACVRYAENEPTGPPRGQTMISEVEVR